MVNLENQLVPDMREDKEVSLERALLIASGLQTEEEIDEYVDKLHKIQMGFIAYTWANVDYSRISRKRHPMVLNAKLLFDYFWKTKPRRCGANALFTQVIDAQLSEDMYQEIGNCVGLTSLYTVIGLREKLNLSLLSFLPGQPGQPGHLKNRLRSGNNVIDIENTMNGGFGYREDLGPINERPSFYLVSLAYIFQGNTKGKQGDLEGAIADYTQAIEISPDYAKLYISRGYVYFLSEKFKKAVWDYNRAIQLDPNDPNAYYFRGELSRHTGKTKKAQRDFDRYTRLKNQNNN